MATPAAPTVVQMPARESSRVVSLWVLGALTLAGAAIRAWPVASRALWHDEVMTVKYLQPGLWQILTWRNHYEHPPLSYLLAYLSVQLFGHDAEWVVRLPALLCGILCIPVAYAIGSAIGARLLGLLAAGQVAFDLNQITVSQQARMYTPTVLFTMLTVLATIHALRDPRWLRWCVVGVCMAAAYASSHMGIIVWAALPLSLTVWLAWREAEHRDTPLARPVFAGLGVAFATAVALCSVGFVVMLSRLSWFRDKSGTEPLIRRALGVLNDFAHSYGTITLSALMLGTGVAGLILMLRRRRAIALLLLAMIAINALFILPVQPHGFEPRPRYVIIMQLPVWIGVAYLIASMQATLVRNALMLALAGVLAWLGAASVAHGDHWRYRFGEVIQEVRTRVAPGDAVVYYPAWIEALPAYYDLPPTHTPPFGGTSEFTGQPISTLPTDHATWVVVAYHLETGATDTAPDLMQQVADRYGLTVDREEAMRLLRAHPIVVARIGPSDVELRGYATPERGGD